MKAYCFVVGLAMLTSCNSTSVKLNNATSKTCDTMFYTFNKNERTENVIDSVLRNYTVKHCNFNFSDTYDTLIVSFAITDSSLDMVNEIYSSRFLLLKNKRIRVLAGEDFFIPLNTLEHHYNQDPNYISIALTIPRFNVIDIVKYPPE